MKKLLIASAIALASFAASTLPSQAASVEVIASGGPGYHRHHDHRGDWGRRHYHRHCYTKVVKRWHHGRRVVTKQRVCR
jgi:Ni/Co efflux regulator RcnB